jgi:crotonobetainyl-CoA:carnitine CoA-transferase CaiB-like acyl-CoA transferase
VAELRTDPLERLRIVEIAGQFGSMAGRILADLGAEVIIVEPSSGVFTRHEPPFADDVSLWFAYRNTNKRSVGLDLTVEDDRRSLHDLLATADVLIESHRPGSHPEGLDPSSLESTHPHLVVASITAFGQDGPYADFAATDAALAAVAGAVFKAGVAEREPLFPPGTFAHDVGDIHSAYAILLALWQRRSSGYGQALDISINEAVAQTTDWSFSNASTQVHVGTEPTETRVGAGPIYTIFKCKGGYVRLIILSPRQWHAMRSWLGEPDYLQDPELDGFVGRLGIAEAVLNPLFETHFAAMEMEEVAAEAQRRGIVCTPVLTPTEVLSNEHFVSRGTFVEGELSAGLSGPISSGFFDFDGQRQGYRTRSPEPGEHTAEVFADLGESQAAPAGTRPVKAAPLEGLRVCDFGHGGVGVEVGRLLGEYGANVVKIESRTYPDFIRSVMGSEMSSSFSSSSRSKRSLGVNAKEPQGHELLLKFVESSDVVIENNSTGTMDSLDLGYDDLSTVNEDIVMFSSQLLGSYGAWKDWIGYGPNTQPVSGMIHLWNYTDYDGPAGNTAIYPDHLVGRVGAVAVMAGLLARERLGRGTHIEAAQVETPIALLGDIFFNEGVTPGSAAPLGNNNDRGAPWGVFPCDGPDKWVAITVTDDEQWSALVEEMGSPDWADDSVYATAEARLAARDELASRVAEWTAQYDRYELMARLQSRGVSALPMLTGSDQLRDPHFIARKYCREIEQQGVGTISLEGQGFNSTAMTDAIIFQAPMLGEHTDEICAELGFSALEIATLYEQGVLETTDMSTLNTE